MKLPLLLALCLALTVRVRAAIVYNFDGIGTDYSPLATNNPNLKQADGTTDFANNTQRVFSTNAMQPSTNYNGPAFFGGYTVDSPTGVGYNIVRIESDQAVNNVTGDFLRFTQNFVADPINNEVAFMGATQESVFAAGSSVTVRVVRDTGNMRLILRSGGLYYVSNQAVDLTNTNGIPAQTFNLAALTYSLYDPVADLDYTANVSTYNPYTTAFDAVGLLISRSGTASVNTYLGQFTVDAAPVPEAGSAALTLVGLALLRRRVRQ